MLVIRRRAGQSILIGDNIEIEVIEVTPTRVKLGIVAPKQIGVVRKEIVLTQEANRAAASGVSPERLQDLMRELEGWPPALEGESKCAGGKILSLPSDTVSLGEPAMRLPQSRPAIADMAGDG